MPDGFREFEAVLGALSKMTSDETVSDDLLDARCPKCNASSFIKITDLYDQARLRLEESEGVAGPPLVAGLSDEDILERFAPPQRRSPLWRIGVPAVVLGAIVILVLRQFGVTAAELAAAGALVLLVGITLTTFRKLGDDYYDRRRRWRKLYICRKCGQLVEP
jgi:hypothetical protein